MEEDGYKCNHGLTFISKVKWWGSLDINGLIGWSRWHNNKNRKKTKQEEVLREKRQDNKNDNFNITMLFNKNYKKII